MTREDRESLQEAPRPSLGASLLCFTPNTASRAVLIHAVLKTSRGTGGADLFLHGQGCGQRVISHTPKFRSEASHTVTSAYLSGHQATTCLDPCPEQAHLECRLSMAACGRLNSGQVQRIFRFQKRPLSSGWHPYHSLYFSTESSTTHSSCPGHGLWFQEGVLDPQNNI